MRWLDRLLRRPRRIEVLLPDAGRHVHRSGRYGRAAEQARRRGQRSRECEHDGLQAASAWPTATSPTRRVRRARRPRCASAPAPRRAMIGRDDAQGASQETGRSLDVAIQGPGFIQVKRRRPALAHPRRQPPDRRAGPPRHAGRRAARAPGDRAQGHHRGPGRHRRRRHRHGQRQGRRQDHPRQRRQPRRPRRRRRQPLPGHRHQRRREPRSAHDAPRLGRARDAPTSTWARR